MERKNTILLTVIAVATLLVAVVGATFAFFAVQADSDATVEIETTTAKAADYFNATGSGVLTLNVTNDKMLQADSSDSVAAITDTDDSMTVTVKAGSNTLNCSYKITYTQADGTNTYSPSKAEQLEYTIQGTSTYSGHTIAETNMDKVTTFGPFNISDTADAGDAAAQVATTETWTLTASFYNLTVDQAAQMDKTYAGTFAITDVTCANSGAQN